MKCQDTETQSQSKRKLRPEAQISRIKSAMLCCVMGKTRHEEEQSLSLGNKYSRSSSNETYTLRSLDHIACPDVTAMVSMTCKAKVLPRLAHRGGLLLCTREST